MERNTNYRAGAAALALVLSLSVTAPVFAAREERDRRDVRERIVRFIKKVFSVTANNDGITPPNPGKP